MKKSSILQVIKMKNFFLMILYFFFFTLGCSFPQNTMQPISAKLPDGNGSFIFTDQANSYPPITVWYYKPPHLKKDSKIVFVMHGVKRNGQTYRDSWIKHASKYHFLLLVPEFSKRYYPGGRKYNQGNMFTKSGRPIDESRWTFSAIERLFDQIRFYNKLTCEKYYIYGHSAGAQFVHRLLLFKKNARIKMAIAANAGWYTMPDRNFDFPYGIGNSGLSEGQLQKALSKTLIILLGTHDNDPNHKYLRKTPEAVAQGSNRLERGRAFYQRGKTAAKERRISYGWKLIEVQGVGHSNVKMSVEASKLISK